VVHHLGDLDQQLSVTKPAGCEVVMQGYRIGVDIRTLFVVKVKKKEICLCSKISNEIQL
jgi:hypothetical protein